MAISVFGRLARSRSSSLASLPRSHARPLAGPSHLRSLARLSLAPRSPSLGRSALALEEGEMGVDGVSGGG